jgi:hypothetical protein
MFLLLLLTVPAIILLTAGLYIFTYHRKRQKAWGWLLAASLVTFLAGYELFLQLFTF